MNPSFNVNKRAGITALFILLIFLFSCTTKTISENNASQKTAVMNDTQLNETNQTLLNQEINMNTTGCTAHWKCLSSSTKIYLLANCSFGQRQVCKFGCTNDTCSPAPVCSPGFGCSGQYYKGYQLEDCTFTSLTRCEYGCENAECKVEPNETTSTPPPSVVENSPPRPVMRTLQMGQVDEVSVGGVKHNVSLYFLTVSQAKIQVDTLRSSWLKPGDTASFANGMTIVLGDILFQSFPGGKQEVEYRVE